MSPIIINIMIIDTPVGPAIPSLMNDTGSANNGFDVWGRVLVIDAQEAS